MKNIIQSLVTTKNEAVVMEKIHPRSFYRSLEQIPDGRKAKGKRYPLPLLLTVICLAKLAGETTISGVVDWSRNRAALLRQHLDWPGGFPTNSTYTYALCRTDAEQVVQVIAQVLIRARAEQEEEPGAPTISQVAMDGKAMRGTWSQEMKEREKKRAEEQKQKKQKEAAEQKQKRRAKREGQAIKPEQPSNRQEEPGEAEGSSPSVHLLTFYECWSGVVLAQRSIGHKENEISAAAALMHPALVKGRLISADAMHTQKKWCAAVIALGGEYLLFAKGNQPTLWQDLHDFFTDPDPEREEWEEARQVHKGHGRLEVRHLWTSTQMNAWLEPQWAGIEQVFQVHRQVSRAGKIHEETIYGLTSLTRRQANADRLLTHIQTHWRVENGLHWRRDVTLGEDACRVRQAGAPPVLAALNGAVLGLMDFLGVSNVAKQMRYFDAHPSEMVSLLCRDLQR